MPKWTEYTSKETLADNDEVMLYDATGKANKRGLMSKFWDYVVDKMATAVISKLETNNKTIIGAINALNSDTTTLANQIRNFYFWRGGGATAQKIKRITCQHQNAEFFVFDDGGNVGMIYLIPDKAYFKSIKSSEDSTKPFSVKFIENKVFEITTTSWDNVSIFGGNAFTVDFVS